MPLVKKIGAYEFRFYSRGEATEPPHIHVKRGRLEAKFWLTPTVLLARPGRYRLHELNQIAQLYCGCDENRRFPQPVSQDVNAGFHTEQRLVEANQQELIEAWHEYFE